MSSTQRTLIFAGGAVLLVLFFINFVIPYYWQTSYVAQIAGVPFILPKPEYVVTHLPTPLPLKGLYMTSCVAGTKSWRQSLRKLIEETELNAVVIDIKDYTGTVSFPNDFPHANPLNGCVVGDMGKFVSELHESGIYVIGRISVFQDPAYSNLFPELAVKASSTGGVWRDKKGLSFIDVGAKPYWDYILDLAKASYTLGFDELNFDYVRYPSDGNMAEARYMWLMGTSTKAVTLENFFSYLSANLKGTGVVTSVDLFGMTMTVMNDMGIGQVLEQTLPYFDFVSPMVYPSHYPPTWNGFGNPAEYPYEVVKIAMTTGREREVAWNTLQGLASTTPSKLRPWLQDFNLGATYDVAKVRAQIQATYDSGLTSWMIWSAGNKYTVGALLLN